MATKVEKAYQQGRTDMSESCNRAVEERTDAYNSKLREIENLQAENKRLKETSEIQGKECERRHNVLCEIKEIIDEYLP